MNEIDEFIILVWLIIIPTLCIGIWYSDWKKGLILSSLRSWICGRYVY